MIDGELRKLKASFRIGRNSTGNFSLEIQDVVSKQLVLRGEINPGEFANFMSNRHACGSIELSSSSKIGKKHECQRVELHGVDLGEKDSVKVLAEQWERANPAWTIDIHDIELFNHHRFNKGVYTVTARRYVAVNEDDS
jgi:hypothetical protein